MNVCECKQYDKNPKSEKYHNIVYADQNSNTALPCPKCGEIIRFNLPKYIPYTQINRYAEKIMEVLNKE